MEIVAQTDYQDVYRITDGVLFIVNKFIPIDYSDETKEYIRVYRTKAKYKSYNKKDINESIFITKLLIVSTHIK